MSIMTRYHEVLLSERYEIKVTVKSNENIFAGRLILSPEKISITISGDLGPSRVQDFNPTYIDELICESIDRKFLIVKLNFSEGSGQSLDHGKKLRHFSLTYEAAAALIFPRDYNRELVDRVDIYSPSVANWVGNTAAQHEYLLSNGDTPLKSVLFADIPDRGHIEIAYNTSRHLDQSRRSAGVGYELLTSFCSEQALKPVEILDYLDDFKTFFEVIEGGNPSIDKITLDADGTEGHLYISTLSGRPRHYFRTNIFPLGRDLSHPNQLPEFPVESIAAFFSLNSVLMERWKKSVAYRNIGVLEDRFLGAFRILEAFTLRKGVYIQDEVLLKTTLDRLKPIALKIFQSEKAKNIRDLISRVIKLNTSRYNTATCITKFYASLNAKTTENWKIQAKDIGGVCEKRNDITHANPYFITDKQLNELTGFVETLLFVALLDSIKVPRIATEVILNRHDAYWLIMKPKTHS